MTEPNDATSWLLEAAAGWIAEAQIEMHPDGRQALAAAMTRPDADVVLTLQLRRGTIALNVCVAGIEPVELVRAEAPPLRPDDGRRAAH